MEIAFQLSTLYIDILFSEKFVLFSRPVCASFSSIIFFLSENTVADDI